MPAPNTPFHLKRSNMQRRHFLRLAAGLAAYSTLPALPVQAAAPHRIISIGGSVTECVYALGAQGNLVGVDSTSTWPDPVRKLPVVGYQRTLSAEGLLSLGPSLILASHEAGPPPVLARLRDAGVRVVAVPETHDPRSPITKLNLLGDTLGRQEAAARLIDRIETEWRATQSRLKQYADRPRVLFILGHGGSPMVGGSDTGVHAMIELARGENAANFKGYKPMSAEGVIMARPDVILLNNEGLAAVGGPDALWKLPGLTGTPAYKNRRLATLNALLLLGFGPRLPEAVDKLASALRQA